MIKRILFPLFLLISFNLLPAANVQTGDQKSSVKLPDQVGCVTLNPNRNAGATLESHFTGKKDPFTGTRYSDVEKL